MLLQPLSQINADMPTRGTLAIIGSAPHRPSSPQAGVSLLSEQTDQAYKKNAAESRQGEANRLGTAHELQAETATRLQFLLLLGADLVLLQTRRDILRHFGYQAVQHIVCSSFVLPPIANVALVHLCQTVEPVAAIDLARRIRALSPYTVILYTAMLHQPEVNDFTGILAPLLHPALYANAVGSFLRS